MVTMVCATCATGAASRWRKVRSPPQESRSTGDALPKRVEKAIETGNALVTEAGRAC